MAAASSCNRLFFTSWCGSRKCTSSRCSIIRINWLKRASSALKLCASAEFLVRMEGRTSHMGSIVPHAVREFQNDDLDWLIHRQLYLRKIDVLQLEYTPLAQYRGAYQRIASILFEHDVYFQSIARGLDRVLGMGKLTARFEYLRALRYELRMLPECDRVQVCTRENKEYLASFLPQIRGKLQEGLRAGIDTARYNPVRPAPEPDTMLSLGGFRHSLNAIAVEWFARKVMPRILAVRPGARLIVIGADPPPAHAFADLGGAMEILGFVDDIRHALARYAIFVCPILVGSGVRVKLLGSVRCGNPDGIDVYWGRGSCAEGWRPLYAGGRSGGVREESVMVTGESAGRG